MKAIKSHILVFLIAALVAPSVLWTGCETLNSDRGKLILNIGLRLAAYELVKSNPSMRPALETVVQTVRGIDQFLMPESVNDVIDRAIMREVSDPAHQILALEVSAMLVEYYKTVYQENLQDLSTDKYNEILNRLVDAIESGMMLVPASGVDRYEAGRVVMDFH